MPAPVVTNFASSILTSDVIPSDTEISIQTGDALLFPDPAGDEYAVLVIEDVNGSKEIVHLTSRVAEVLTIERAQEGTSAQSFLAGSRVECRVTAGFLEEFVDGGEY